VTAVAAVTVAVVAGSSFPHLQFVPCEYLFYTDMLLYLFKNVYEYSSFKRFFCTNVVGTKQSFDKATIYYY
jgi:hypothetical protein